MKAINRRLSLPVTILAAAVLLGGNGAGSDRGHASAGADTEDRGGGSRPCSRQHDDQRIRPARRPNGLRVGISDGERAQPPCGICRSARARTAGRRRAGCAGRLQPDADQLRQAGTDLHRLSQPGRRLRGRIHRARQGADGHSGAGLRRPLLRLRNVRPAHRRDRPDRQAVWHEARLLHDRRAELER